MIFTRVAGISTKIAYCVCNTRSCAVRDVHDFAEVILYCLNLSSILAIRSDWDNAYPCDVLRILVLKITSTTPRSFMSNVEDNTSFVDFIMVLFLRSINKSSMYRQTITYQHLYALHRQIYLIHLFWIHLIHSLIKNIVSLFRCLFEAIKNVY